MSSFLLKRLQMLLTLSLRHWMTPSEHMGGDENWNECVCLWWLACGIPKLLAWILFSPQMYQGKEFPLRLFFDGELYMPDPVCLGVCGSPQELLCCVTALQMYHQHT